MREYDKATPNRYDIPVGGPEDAVKREDLAKLWGVPDRRVRKIIEKFRETDSGDPYPILSTSSGAGYWRSDDVKDMERFAAEMSAKARGHFGALREVRRAIKRENTKGQMTIDGLMERRDTNV